ncbi:hypothetical protein [Hydrogenophaga sp.]|uniref:hypothetical protein n=1 Tax=Hydrogenophaga sp. TaxID=1904254 RepID=UPI00272F7D25|nr:hypothetical protein [Hydrogenophaga sp.]MDP2018808.1 hypothetical protein [Hydrogenophaga sp.]MDP3164271.1 hypothetical protein [Hydrogenophaga sp.]MDP3810765.1 hypothetical protein [Hydrogenophaga sp.]
MPRHFRTAQHTPPKRATGRWVMACATLALFVAGCKDQSPAPAPVSAASPADASAAPATDKWLGKWNGPEGTFLQLAGGNGQYEVTIQNLDGPRTFQGKAAGQQIEFEREGVKESLRATNGAETGMKWLSDRSNCLTVRTGEGYCRD